MKKQLNQYQSVVKVENLDDEQLRNALQALLDRLGLVLVQEATPDYKHIEIFELKELSQ